MGLRRFEGKQSPLVHNRPQQAGFKHSRGLGLSNTQCASIGSLLPFTTQKATPPNGATLEIDSTQAGLPSQTAVLTHWQGAGNTVDASGPSPFFYRIDESFFKAKALENYHTRACYTLFKCLDWSRRQIRPTATQLLATCGSYHIRLHFYNLLCV